MLENFINCCNTKMN